MNRILGGHAGLIYRVADAVQTIAQEVADFGWLLGDNHAGQVEIKLALAGVDDLQLAPTTSRT